MTAASQGGENPTKVAGVEAALRYAATALVEIWEGDENEVMSFMEHDVNVFRHLPPKHRHRYDETVVRCMVVSLLSVGAKLDAWLRGNKGEPLGCACVGEELALNAIVSEAGAFPDADPYNLPPGWRDDLRSILFEDLDFTWLWDGALDGVERADNPISAKMLVANLEYRDWFAPFGDRGVSPYLTALARKLK